MQWDFTKRIEDMSLEEVSERIKSAYEFEMPKIIPIPYVGVEGEVVEYAYPELTALCPMTGIQDLYNVSIVFVPNKFVPELKSLKFYFLAFRDLPISHEHLASKIEEEFKSAINPEEIQITLDVAVRGGIKTTIIV